MPEDKPRFGFLVSIQSHGDYTMNDASLDIVHAATDYGEYDELMDEYLSCIHMSDAAVQELCDYFTKQYEETGRKVVLALAGAHAPSFVDHVADKTRTEGNDLQILERSTPFFIWANYPLENIDAATSTADSLNRMDMVMLAPTIAQQAGLPLTGYYKYLLAMKQQTPVVTAANDYMKVDGTTGTYGEDESLDSWVKGNITILAPTPSVCSRFLGSNSCPGCEKYKEAPLCCCDAGNMKAAVVLPWWSWSLFWLSWPF